MTRNTTRTLLAAPLLLAVVLASAGCVPQSRESVDEFVTALRAVPGVVSAEARVSQPLPGVINGTVTVAIPADPIVLADAQKVVCAERPASSVEVDYVVSEGAATVSGDGPTCAGEGINIVDVTRAAAAVGFPATLEIKRSYPAEGEGRTTVRRSSAEKNLAEALTLGEAIAPALPDMGISYRSPALDVDAPRADLAGYLGDMRVLGESYQLASVTIGSGVRLGFEGIIPSSAAVSSLLDGLSPERYAGLEIIVTAAENGSADAQATAPALALRDELAASLGATGDVRGNDVVFTVTDIDALQELSDAILAREGGSGGSGVTFYIPGSGDGVIPEMRVAPGRSLVLQAGLPNAFTALDEQYRALRDAGAVATVEVGGGRLSAWTLDGADPGQVARVAAVLAELQARFGLSEVNLNNRPLAG